MYNEYNEVIEILNYIPKEDFNKIPTDIINMFKAYMNPNYHFKYDANKTLEEQNVSKEARTIIAIFFRDYWATPEQRDKIKAKERYDMTKREEEKRETYNTDDLFKNNPTKVETTNSSMAMIEYKESFIMKTIKRIKNIFKLNNK